MRYDENDDAFFLRLFSGGTITIPRALIRRFRALTPTELHGSRLAPDGSAVIVNDETQCSVPVMVRLLSPKKVWNVD